MNKQELTEKIIHFIRSIGLEAAQADLGEATFLPGIHIEKGTILYDPEKLLYPGDLLHEAGHLAILTSEERLQLCGDIKAEEAGRDITADEIGASLWSYAALKAIGLPPEVVFHPDGYRGASPWFIEQFENKVYIGLPLLVWMGLTHEESPHNPSVRPFPHMQRWLRA